MPIFSLQQTAIPGEIAKQLAGSSLSRREQPMFCDSALNGNHHGSVFAIGFG
jgi:hypothetical protein